MCSKLPILSEDHAKMNVGTDVLRKIVDSSITSSKHFRCLLIEIKLQTSNIPHFDSSWLDPIKLFQRNIYDIKVYKVLLNYGMIISHCTIEQAVISLPEFQSNLFELLVSECPNNFALEDACQAANSRNKTVFLAILKKFTQVSSY